MKKPIDQLKPEDAIPLLIKIRNLALGTKKPDGFTRLIFILSLFAWMLLAFWNAISYFVLLSADVIEQNKGFSVKSILIKNGQHLGFNGEEFLSTIENFYFYNIFIWIFVFVGIVLLYRKKRIYTAIILGSLLLHFGYMFFALGIQYFIEDVSFLDKILYASIILMVILHSFLMNKETTTTKEFIEQIEAEEAESSSSEEMEE